MSTKYSDEELRAKAICTLTAINDGQPHGIELIMVMSQITRMHPQAVVQEIQRRANMKI